MYVCVRVLKILKNLRRRMHWNYNNKNYQQHEYSKNLFKNILPGRSNESVDVIELLIKNSYFNSTSLCTY